MKNIFETPVIEVVLFDNEDVITISEEMPGVPGDDYEENV